MSAPPPANTAVVSPPASKSVKGQKLLLKKMLRENGAPDDEVDAVDTFDSPEDFEPFFAHFAKQNSNPSETQKLLADKEQQMLALKGKLNKAGTPPDRKPGSIPEDVKSLKWNVMAVENASRACILPGALPLSVDKDGDEVMF